MPARSLSNPQTTVGARPAPAAPKPGPPGPAVGVELQARLLHRSRRTRQFLAVKFPLAPGWGWEAPGVCLNRQTISNKAFKNRHYLCNYEMSCNGIVANFTLSDRERVEEGVAPGEPESPGSPPPGGTSSGAGEGRQAGGMED